MSSEITKTAWADEERDRMQALIAHALERARSNGASQAEAGASLHEGLAVTVRLGEVETLEYSRDRGLSITVYFGDRKGSASCGDLERDSLDASVDMACDIARYTEGDPCNGLADAQRMASEFPDLDLWHPRELDPHQAIELAREMEQEALDFDPLIRNSDGASISSGSSVSVYGNSHGFLGHGRGTRHSMSCVVIAQDEADMQRDYYYDLRRRFGDLLEHRAIGRQAAERAVRRHGAGSVPTCRVPVLFTPEAARTLLRHFVAAVSGGNLYRKASFLLDQAGERLFPEFVQLEERPLEARGLASTAYDAEGVATAPRHLVADGVLQGYVLGSYSARRLGLESTANAGGVHNLTLVGGQASFEELVAELGRGLVVTELMGQGVNIVTGDYSRGAAGYWVEQGRIQRPVEGVTVAGNLREMFQGITALGDDVDYRSGIRCGSVLVGTMTVAGE